jgi:hypothetical protein
LRFLTVLAQYASVARLAGCGASTLSVLTVFIS